MCAHAYAAVHDGSVFSLRARSLLSEDVATTVSPGLAASTASKPYTGPLSSLLAPSVEETAVTSVRQEAAAKKRGHYHYLSATARAAIGKYASENGNSAAARHFSPNCWAC